MHFRIFIPRTTRVSGASKEPLVEVGLGHLAENFIGENRDTERSIQGKTGVLYHWQQPGDMGFSAEGLEWTPAKEFRGLAEGRYFVGMNPEKLPTPTEMAVPLQVTGDHITLGNGNRTWVIPDVLFLPTKVILTANSARHERLARFQSRTIACRSWIAECEDFTKQLRDFKTDDASPVCDWVRAWNFAYDSLAINYRVTPEVVDALDLFASDSLRGIILAAIGAFELHRKERLDAQVLPPNE